MRNYFIEVKTADESDAGTNANIRIRIIGANGTTSQALLDTSGHDDFERNCRDVYPLSLEDVGAPQAIEVAHTDGGSAWKLSWIKVSAENTSNTTSNAGTWGAQYNDWLNGQTVQLTLAPANSQQTWLSLIPDSTPVHDLNIPGTHDSATFKPAHAYDQCQTLTIRQQLDLGIRFLDLRLRCFINPSAANPILPAAQRENFTIYHSSNWQNLYFDADSWVNDKNMSNFPLQDCLAFLQAFPSETILISIKQEHYDNSTEQSRFAQAFKDLIARHDNGKNFYTGTQVPTLEDARGRIVIINRDQSIGSGYGIDWSWPDADRGIQQINGLYIEDNYMDTTTSAKEGNIKQNLQQANAKQAGQTTWFGTFTSCAPGNASPYAWANTINPYVESYIDGVGTGAFYGTVIMDYPPKSLVDKLVERYMVAF
ncbi:1-phosphatidylinositol phosphodiesterase [Andreprevotia lacus DSM 23236]|jgi:1-phosphatidylinositol phosphodiesterase|uniref:1-phosphatidylinositol phosphodiesterase n=1 Tax=Andreprevotia lacus DSM 23236 TaxID=1121001 RepID=A0A1W1X8C4_9NEIS|nr:PLAT/LH2 domain-containing protein [Andreprevotia lacus]SMC20235.1 1-phosphatidylinositol phosphodiesterase [Andreprevotia lacus DSM 23236]